MMRKFTVTMTFEWGDAIPDSGSFHAESDVREQIEDIMTEAIDRKGDPTIIVTVNEVKEQSGLDTPEALYNEWRVRNGGIE